MNTIHIAGFLGGDPIVQYTPTGKKVIKLRIGSKTRKKGADDTIWWRGTIWGEQFDKMMPYLKKGSPVMFVA
jgi:single-strand DNA-binding protein